MSKSERVLPLQPLWRPETDTWPKTVPYRSSRAGLVCLNRLSPDEKRRAWEHMKVHAHELAEQIRTKTGALGALMEAFPGCDLWVERSCTGLPAPTLPASAP